MLHLRARYFPTQEGAGLLRAISLTFSMSLINLTKKRLLVLANLDYKGCVRMKTWLLYN